MNGNEVISTLASAHARHAVSPQPQGRPGLRARMKWDLDLAFERSHRQDAAQCGLRKAHRQVGVRVEPFAV